MVTSSAASPMFSVLVQAYGSKTLAIKSELTFSEASEFVRACVEYMKIYVLTLPEGTEITIDVGNEFGTIELIRITQK